MSANECVGDERWQDWRSVVQGLRLIARNDTKARLLEAELLRAAERLRVWRDAGCASLPQLLERELGLGPKLARERLRVAKALAELPEIAAALARGELTYSAVRELTRVATPTTEREWLDEVRGKVLRDVERSVSARARGARPSDPPDPDLKPCMLRFEVLPATKGRVREAQRLLERERGERLDDDQLLDAFATIVLDHLAAGPTTPVVDQAHEPAATPPSQDHPAPFPDERTASCGVVTLPCIAKPRRAEPMTAIGGDVAESMTTTTGGDLGEATTTGRGVVQRMTARGGDIVEPMTAIGGDPMTTTMGGDLREAMTTTTGGGVVQRMTARGGDVAEPMTAIGGDVAEPMTTTTGGDLGEAMATSGGVVQPSARGADVAEPGPNSLVARPAEQSRSTHGGPSDRRGDRGLARARYQIAITQCSTCKQAWQVTGGIDAPIAQAMLERATCDAVHLGSLLAETPSRATQDVPPAVRRLVELRDGYRCCVPGCRSTSYLELHHIEFRSNGGSHEPRNLTVACGGHHHALHDGKLGITGTAPDRLVFTWHDTSSHFFDEHLDVTSLELDTELAEIAPHVGLRGAKHGGISDRELEQPAPLADTASAESDLVAVTPHVGLRGATTLLAEAELVLVTLGFKKLEARRALAAAMHLQSATPTLEQLVRDALRQFAPARR